MDVNFVFPEKFLTNPLPESSDSDWSSLSAESQPTIYYIYIILKELGYAVTKSSSIKRRAINIGHPLSFSEISYKDFSESYIVCWQQDYPRCHLAHRHIVMNSAQQRLSSLKMIDRLSIPGPRDLLHYIPEPSLIPRSLNRGNEFSRIGYYGNPKNLIPEIQTKEWIDRLNAEGMNLIIKDARSESSDCSDIDCILAIRPNTFSNKQKSAHKLWNAWRAGTPAVLGYEPGFRDYKYTDLDYVEANSAEEALQALIKLKSKPDLISKMVANGLARATEVSSESLIRQWCVYLDTVLIPKSAEWDSKGSFYKRSLFLVRSFRLLINRFRKSI